MLERTEDGLPAAKWSCPLVRRGSGPGGGVVEVEAAGGVEGVLAGADGQAGGEDRFVVVVVAGAVDRELPVVGGADVAQSAEFERGGVGQGRVDVAEVSAVADVQAGDLGPAFAGPGGQSLFQRGFRRVRVFGHDGYLP